jgi:hypothetical protein
MLLLEAKQMANIPKDWHQKWLQKFLDSVEAAVAEAGDIAGQAAEALEQLTDQDRQLDVDGYLKKAQESAERFSEELEDVWGYLNVDPEWTDEDLDDKPVEEG